MLIENYPLPRIFLNNSEKNKFLNYLKKFPSLNFTYKQDSHPLEMTLLISGDYTIICKFIEPITGRVFESHKKTMLADYLKSL